MFTVSPILADFGQWEILFLTYRDREEMIVEVSLTWFKTTAYVTIPPFENYSRMFWKNVSPVETSVCTISGFKKVGVQGFWICFEFL